MIPNLDAWQESKRAREQESKRAREQESKREAKDEESREMEEDVRKGEKGERTSKNIKERHHHTVTRLTEQTREHITNFPLCGVTLVS